MKVLIGFAYDPSVDFKIIPLYVEENEVDYDSQDALYNSRINICNQCPELVIDASLNKNCSICNCTMQRARLIYPLDDEGKAFKAVENFDQEKTYVCQLKKW